MAAMTQAAGSGTYRVDLQAPGEAIHVQRLAVDLLPFQLELPVSV